MGVEGFDEMRIAYVVPTFPPDKGGMGNAAYHMAVKTVEMGHEVVVFTPLYRNLKETVNNHFKVVRVRPFVKYGKAAFVPQLLFHLWNFDIVHLHYPFFGGVEAVWLLKKCKKRLKLIVSYHMDVVGTGLKSAIFRAHTNLFLSRIISSADRVIVSSYDYAEHSYINDLVSREKIVEIPFGVDDMFIPQDKDKELMGRWGITYDELVVLFVGGLEYFKGVDCLIKSIPFLKGKVKLLVVGDGPLMDSCKRLVDNLKLSNKVLFAGFAAEEELVKYYNLSDVFILPSIDRSEAFGIVLIEAMACGKPVISANLPGIRTVIDEKYNGFLVAPGSVPDIAKKIQMLLDSGELRRRFGQNGRRKVLERYNWDEVGKKLNEVYLSME